MKKIKILSYTVFILFLGATAAFCKLTISEIVKEYADSVVTIIALDENDQPVALGSGFFINKNGEIATNHHVLEKGVKAIIKTSQGKKGEILKIVKDDPNIDILVAKTTLKNTKPIPLGDSDSAVVGEDIIAIGNPEGLENTVSKGIISGIRNTEGTSFFQITAPISPGSSGGPILNSRGQVIGIATAYLKTGQNLNFAMPINYLKTLKSTSLRLGSLPKNVLNGEGPNSEKDSDVRVQDNGWIRIKDVFVKNTSLAEDIHLSKDDPKYEEYSREKHKLLYVEIMFLKPCKATPLKAMPSDEELKKEEERWYECVDRHKDKLEHSTDKNGKIQDVIGSEIFKVCPNDPFSKGFKMLVDPDYMLRRFHCDYRMKIFVSFYSSEGLEIETRGVYDAAKKLDEISPGETDYTFLSVIPENATSWKVWVSK